VRSIIDMANNKLDKLTLREAVLMNDLERVKTFLDNSVCPDPQDTDGFTPLMLACVKGNVEMVGRDSHNR
jgi:ankyrin repeat protein